MPERGHYVVESSYTKDQVSEANARRAMETRQVESRMGRLALYHKSTDGIVYTLPIEPKRRTELPTGLQAVKSFQLIIPLLYPLQPLRILLNDVDSDAAEATEELFTQTAAGQNQMTLMSHINYLTQNLHVLAKQAETLASSDTLVRENDQVLDARQESGEARASEEDKGHVKLIPRPPEWSFAHENDESGSSDGSDYSDDDDGGGAALDLQQNEPSAAPSQRVERGTALTFPSIELHGLELLQVSILSISVKCDRCKTVNEVGGLRSNTEKSESCRKCASAFAVRFRPEFVHQASTRAGFLDISGASVADFLPR